MDLHNQFAFFDWLIIAAYLLFLIFLTFRKKRNGREEGEVDYILAGRRLTIPAFVATLVSSWYGGILGVGEFTYQYGISNWIVFGLPYYIYAIIFALFFAKNIRESNLLTIPDQFQMHLGKGPAGFAGLLLFIATIPAPYILMVGILIDLLTGMGLIPAVIVGTVFSMIYVYRGGFKLVVQTDIYQFILMFGGFIILFAILNINEFPFWELPDKLPDQYFSLTGGNSVAFILAWYIIAAQTLVDPNFYQRCYAAKTPAAAKKGILFSIGFWILFDFLTTFTGLYSRALLSENINPAQAFPLLGIQYLPVVFKGLFFTGLLATIMSTIDSFSFVSAISIGRDTLYRLIGRKKNQSEKWIKYSLLFVGTISLLIIFFERSIIEIWFDIGSLTIPSLLIPILAFRFIKRPMNSIIVLIGMITAAVITGLGIVFETEYEILLDGIIFLQHPIYLGVLINLLSILLAIVLNNKSYTK